MPLSEYEQRVLEQMEQQLGADDPKLPKLASSLESPKANPVGRYVAGAFGVIVGIVLLVVGVAVQLPIIGILGFLAMLVGVIFAVSRPRSRKGTEPSATGTTAKKGSSPRTTKKEKSFMTRLEDRWEKRRRDRGM